MESAGLLAKNELAQGRQLLKAGRLNEAIHCFESALQHDSAMADAHFELACAAELLPDFDRAARHYQGTIESATEWCEPYVRYGALLQKRGRWAEASENYRRALELEPTNQEILLKLGSTLRRLDQHEEAIRHLRRACEIAPDNPHVVNLLGIVLAEQGDLESAMECFRGAIDKQEGLAEAWNNLGNATAAQWRCDEAVRYLRKALEIRPDYPEACDNLGKVFLAQGNWDEASSALEQAVVLRPNYGEAHVNRARLHLLRGDYRSGWQQHEWRHQLMPSPSRVVQRRWNASASAPGQSVLVRGSEHAEEMVPFVRFLPRLQRRGQRVILEVTQPYHDLLSRTPGIDQLVDVQTSLRCDHEIELSSLPWALHLDRLEQVPEEIPYLYPDPKLVSRYRDMAGRYHGLRVGISWKISGPAWVAPPIGMHDLAPLADIPRTTIFCLDQTNPTHKSELGQIVPSVDVAGWLDAQRATWAHWAAVLANLDVVVTSDSAIAHLAGALGVSAYVALPRLPSFCWLLDSDSTSWYPTAKLYRQSALGNWRDVFRRIAEDLRVLATANASEARVNGQASDAKRQGTHWARRGLLSEGIASLRYATEIEPGCGETWNNLGVALLEAGRLGEAQHALEESLRLTPGFAKAWNNLGNTCAELNDLDRAIECFHNAIVHNPRYPEAHNNLGNALASRDRDAAIAQYQRALELRPEYAEAMNNLANSLADRGRHDEAIALYQRALEIKPHYAEAHNNLGTALQFIGQSEAALHHLKLALQLVSRGP